MENKNKKGYVFTIDAALAAIIIIGLIGIMHFHSISKSEITIGELVLKKNLDDVFDLLDRQLKLQTVTKATIEADMNKLMLNTYGYRATIEEYRYQSSNNFIKTDDLNIGDFGADLNDLGYVKGRRLFLTFTTQDYNADGGQGHAKAGEIDRFYNLEFYGWIK